LKERHHDRTGLANISQESFIMKVSRRQCVGWLGATVALAPVAVASVQNGETQSEVSDCCDSLTAAALLSPLVVGSSIGRWQITALGALHAGAVSVQLSGLDGQLFHIDICARDDAPGAPEPPAHTDHCDLFIANEGKGNDPTVEDQGLAAMALAEVIRTHENTTDLHGLMTLRARLDLHGANVVRRCV
jgi:hypothetical protein